MIQSFNELPWHDAVILNLVVDRTAPGERDEVRLQIEWPDDEIEEIVFEGCYKLEAHLNFGIVAVDSIDWAMCEAESSELDAFRVQWRAVGGELKHLKRFRISTSSTGGQISIIASGFRRNSL